MVKRVNKAVSRNNCNKRPKGPLSLTWVQSFDFGMEPKTTTLHPTCFKWHPPSIGHYTNFWPLLIWTLLPNLTFYLIVQGFHRTYATVAECQQRALTPPDTWSCPTLGLACVLMSRPISPELVLSPDFWISNTPRYFSFAFKITAMHLVCCYNLLGWRSFWNVPPSLMDWPGWQFLFTFRPEKDELSRGR